jgi:hypothetical protein
VRVVHKTWIKMIGNLVQQINDYISVFWDKMHWRVAGTLVYLNFRLIRFLDATKIVINNQRQINGSMARYGSLFLSFGIIFQSVKQASEYPFKGMLPAPPDCFTTTFRASISISIMVAIIIFFGIWQKYKLKAHLKRKYKRILILFLFLLLLFSLWILPPFSISIYKMAGQASFAISAIFLIAVFFKWFSIKLTEFLEGQFQFVYWVVFWIVYVIGWLNGMLRISNGNITWLFIIGYLWFIVIGIIMLKSAWQTRKT